MPVSSWLPAGRVFLFLILGCCRYCFRWDGFSSFLILFLDRRRSCPRRGGGPSGFPLLLPDHRGLLQVFLHTRAGSRLTLFACGFDVGCYGTLPILSLFGSRDSPRRGVGPGLQPDVDLFGQPSDGSLPDLDGPGKFTAPDHFVDGRAAQAYLFQYLGQADDVFLVMLDAHS